MAEKQGLSIMPVDFDSTIAQLQLSFDPEVKVLADVLERINELCRKEIGLEDYAFSPETRDKISFLKNFQVRLLIFGEGIPRKELAEIVAKCEEYLSVIIQEKSQLEEQQKNQIVKPWSYKQLRSDIENLLSGSDIFLIADNQILQESIGFLREFLNTTEQECSVFFYKLAEKNY